jgi:uncharacterized membrane protein HdeD (DUF308 family)
MANLIVYSRRLPTMTTEYAPERVVNYAFLLGGLTALIFGVILLFRSEQAIGLMVLLLGLWWLIQGAFLIFSVFIDRQDVWWKIIVGIIGITAGIVVLANPVETGEFLGSAFAFILGAMGLITAIAALIGGFRGGGFGAIFFAIISGAISLLIMFYPQDSFSVLVTIVAVILIVQGLAAMYLALTMR